MIEFVVLSTIVGLLGFFSFFAICSFADFISRIPIKGDWPIACAIGLYGMFLTIIIKAAEHFLSHISIQIITK